MLAFILICNNQTMGDTFPSRAVSLPPSASQKPVAGVLPHALQHPATGTPSP